LLHRLLFFWLALSLMAAAELGVGAKPFLTDPGRRAVEASKGYYDFYLQPGDSVQHVVEVENSGDEAALYDIYAGDGGNSAGGTLVGTPKGQPLAAAGRWLTLEKSQLRLQPKERNRAAFRLSVPADTPVGEYLSYLFIQPEPLQTSSTTASSSSQQVQSGMQVRTRVGILVITFVGDTALRRSAWNLSAPAKVYDNGEVFARFQLTNQGNVFLKPRLNWSLTGPQGQLVSQAENSELGYVCARQDLNFQLPLSGGKVLPRGAYQLKVKLFDARYPELTRETSAEVTLP
jgi:hypothetical protein